MNNEYQFRNIMSTIFLIIKKTFVFFRMNKFQKDGNETRKEDYLTKKNQIQIKENSAKSNKIIPYDS